MCGNIKAQDRNHRKSSQNFKGNNGRALFSNIPGAAIQRFEYTSETFWKVVKGYLDVQEGIICNSPKSCFKEAFKVGLLSEEETVRILEMVDDRNLTSHTCHEEIAEEIYRQVGDYWKLMDKVCRRIVESIEFGFLGNPAEK